MNHTPAPQIPGSIGIPERPIYPLGLIHLDTLKTVLLWGPATSVGSMEQKDLVILLGKSRKALLLHHRVSQLFFL